MTDETSATVEITPEATRGARDLPTIIAISIVALAVANVLHEAVGHGGACVLTGGHARVLSSVHFGCDNDSRFIAAAGTLVNFITGFLCWIAFRVANPTRQHLRYFLWLLMTVNLLQAAGYFLFSGVGNIGDWAYVIHDLEPAWLWRTALAVVGTVSSYLLLVCLALLEHRPFRIPCYRLFTTAASVIIMSSVLEAIDRDQRLLSVSSTFFDSLGSSTTSAPIALSAFRISAASGA